MACTLQKPVEEVRFVIEQQLVSPGEILSWAFLNLPHFVMVEESDPYLNRGIDASNVGKNKRHST